MRKKILFVTHTLESFYGAATSLRLLLENYSGIEADLMVPRSFRHRRDLTATAAQFPAVRQVYEISMPIDLGVVGLKRSFAEKAHGVVHWASWRRDYRRYRNIMQDNKYDLVHFNSVVLHKMLLPGMPSMTHVREIVPDRDSPVIGKLAAGAGVLFIDSATQRPFASQEGRMHALMLNNPFDMRGVAHSAGVLRHARLRPTTTVFSMIGRISEMKGVDFVIAAFRRAAGSDSVLLVVGDGPPDYLAHCRNMAGDDSRILFWGEESNIKAVYAVTDYVVRGDPQPCVGRTIYEGLYAGCRVIMPGPGAPDLIFEADRFRESILFYPAGSRNHLTGIFTACAGVKAENRQYRSNVEDYVRAFDAFTDSCIARHQAKS